MTAIAQILLRDDPLSPGILDVIVVVRSACHPCTSQCYIPQMTKFNQNFLSVLTVHIYISSNKFVFTAFLLWP
jgi:hypothetical protein